MGIASVIITFVMCILFNIFLPTGDVGSDVNLMYLTLTFNLGESAELSGCRACYHKTENEVYYREKALLENECEPCLKDKQFECGLSPLILNKLVEWEGEKETCLNNETFRLTNEGKIEVGECDEANDNCCVTKGKDMKKQHNIQTVDRLDPKKLFYPCFHINYELDFCFVTGKSSLVNCTSISTDREYPDRTQELIDKVLSSSSNEMIFFFPYSRINQSWVIEEKNHSITDPEIECGMLFLHYNSNDNNQQRYMLRDAYQCNEDSCLTHLKTLHLWTPIHDLKEWRKRTEFFLGIKIGGATCELLQIYGTCILIPILLNLSFNIVLFVNDFRKQKANLFEIIPLFLLFYPQYKTIKFLAQYLFDHQDENQLNEENEANNRTVAPLEPFLESCLQVNISLAILFATEGFYPKDGQGLTTSYYEDFNSAIPLVTFILSLFASSFGMSKFLLTGPIQFLSRDSPLNGLLSIPFLSLCLINTMFGFRIVCLESAFFTHYRHQLYNFTTFSLVDTQISPIITPQYRLLVYLAPCVIPFLINALRLLCTRKGLQKYFLEYPQFLVSPCFTPFMFEWYETTEQQGQCRIKIWKLGTIINSIYIGCMPQCILCFTDYYKGVNTWEFGKNVFVEGFSSFENNDALFKSQYGNTVFALTTAIFFLILITLFFGSDTIFRERGIHCRCLTIICCPCPNPCISLTDQDLDPLSLLATSSQRTSGENIEEHGSTDVNPIGLDPPHTEVYLYNQGGARKITLLGSSSSDTEHANSQVTKQHSVHNDKRVEEIRLQGLAVVNAKEQMQHDSVSADHKESDVVQVAVTKCDNTHNLSRTEVITKDATTKSTRISILTKMRILDDTRRRKRNRKLRNAKYVELASIGRSIDENATNKTGNQSLRKTTKDGDNGVDTLKPPSSEKDEGQGKEENDGGERPAEKTKNEPASSPETIEEPVEEEKVKGENNIANSKHEPSFFAKVKVHTEEEQVDAKNVVEISKHKP